MIMSSVCILTVIILRAVDAHNPLPKIRVLLDKRRFAGYKLLLISIWSSKLGLFASREAGQEAEKTPWLMKR